MANEKYINWKAFEKPVLHYAGEVENEASLPTESLVYGDTYYITTLKYSVVYTESGWKHLAPDISNKLDKLSSPTLNNVVTVGSEDKIIDSGKKIGGETFEDPVSVNTIATEKGVTNYVTNNIGIGLDEVYGVLTLYSDSSLTTIHGYSKIQYKGTANVTYLLEKGCNIYSDETLTVVCGYASGDVQTWESKTGNTTYESTCVDAVGTPIYWSKDQCSNIVWLNKGKTATEDKILEYIEPKLSTIYDSVGLMSDGTLPGGFNYDSITGAIVTLDEQMGSIDTLLNNIIYGTVTSKE